MIGLRKQPIAKSVKRKKVVFNRFAPAFMENGAAELGIVGGERTGLHTNKTLCAKRSENCDYGENLLKRNVGVKLVYNSAGKPLMNLSADTIRRIFSVRLRSVDNTSIYERYFFACNDGYVRVGDENGTGFELGFVTGGNVGGALLRAVDGEERFLIVGDEKAYYVTADGAFERVDDVRLTGMLCTCKNRLFVLLKDGKLAYSDPMTPWDISESIDGGGYVEFPFTWGTPLALLATQEHVYVFFDKRIVRIEIMGAGRDFCVEQIPYDGGKIAPGSPCAIAGGVIFVAEEGLWRIKGGKTERFYEELCLDLLLSAPICTVAVCNEKYFLSYVNADVELVNIAVDLDGKGWTNCLNLRCLSEDMDGPLFIKDSRLYRLGGENFFSNVYARFESVDIDFGWRGKKVLRRLTLAGKGSLAVDVVCDGRTSSHNITFVDGRATVDVNLRGQQFSFGIEIKDRSYLRSMSVEIET